MVMLYAVQVVRGLAQANASRVEDMHVVVGR